jgi:hypothetical protein
MAAFNAASIVEPLDYDFTGMALAPNNIRELADVRGVIPEPSSVQVRRFMQASARELQRIQREAADAAGKAGQGTGEPAEDAEGADADIGAGDVADAIELLAGADERAGEAARKRDAANVSKLCSGEISAETLMKLPFRIYRGFGKWLWEEITDPEAVTGAGKPHLQIARSPAAG